MSSTPAAFDVSRTITSVGVHSAVAGHDRALRGARLEERYAGRHDLVGRSVQRVYGIGVRAANRSANRDQQRDWASKWHLLPIRARCLSGHRRGMAGGGSVMGMRCRRPV